MIPSGSCVETVVGDKVVVLKMVCRTYLADSPVFECRNADGNIVYVPMYDMKTEHGEAYRQTAIRVLRGHRKLLSDIGCVSTIKECVSDFIPSAQHCSVADMHYVYCGKNIVGSGKTECEAWLSAFDNVL